MKHLLIILLAIGLFSCAENESPEPLKAQVVIGQRVSNFSAWRAALVTFGEEINSVTPVFERGYFHKYETPIEQNQPFALIFETVDWDGRLDIVMKISEKDSRLVTIPDSLTLREVYIHPNGNLPAANQMAQSINFPCKILILE